MKYAITQEQIATYRRQGFLVIEDFLDPTELAEWREAVDEAVRERNGVKFPDKTVKTGEDDGINADSVYFGKVFDQLVNLWQTNARVRRLIVSESLGEAACRLSGSRGIRLWHDQALIKRPWANPTTLHLDSPFWSFSSPHALSLWVALDDATPENGCLCFLPGTHRRTDYRSIGITPNMDTVFETYPDLASTEPVMAPMRAGSASFHNGLCIHGAGPNMTTRPRRAMTCGFMPDGSTFNGEKNILPEEYLSRLKVGDVLNNDLQNPVIFRRAST